MATGVTASPDHMKDSSTKVWQVVDGIHRCKIINSDASKLPKAMNRTNSLPPDRPTVTRVDSSVRKGKGGKCSVSRDAMVRKSKTSDMFKKDESVQPQPSTSKQDHTDQPDKSGVASSSCLKGQSSTSASTSVPPCRECASCGRRKRWLSDPLLTFASDDIQSDNKPQPGDTSDLESCSDCSSDSLYEWYGDGDDKNSEASHADVGEDLYFGDDDSGRWPTHVWIDFEEIRQRRSQEAAPLYPHRSLLYMECQVCLEKAYLRRRVCCDFRICRECMTTYVTMKVTDGRVQVECPNDRCSLLVHRDEVKERLLPEMRERFIKFLVDANADPLRKTCPSCSMVHSIDPNELKVPKRKLKNGLEVRCPQCRLQWCFLCQAPFHSGVTCKDYRKGDAMVRKWAKVWSYRCGQFNAQKCPKCKIYIQKAHGCDHMKCTRCNTDFCYRCGDRYISLKLLGNHWSRFSIFGCKYRLLPERPVLRRFIRGASFGE